MKTYLLFLLVVIFACGGNTDSSDGQEKSPDYQSEVQCRGEGVWFDKDTKLCWQDALPSAYRKPYQDASDYCEGLVREGYSDWRLPTIDELKSTIDGCRTLACEVSDPKCLRTDCLKTESCEQCLPLRGPGTKGCYCQPSLSGPCGSYWSNSTCEDKDGHKWIVNFHYGKLQHAKRKYKGAVRCVRGSMNWKPDPAKVTQLMKKQEPSRPGYCRDGVAPSTVNPAEYYKMIEKMVVDYRKCHPDDYCNATISWMEQWEKRAAERKKNSKVKLIKNLNEAGIALDIYCNEYWEIKSEPCAKPR